MAGSYWVWDDFLRMRNVRRGRQCIQPEVCRNFNFGAQVSAGAVLQKLPAADDGERRECSCTAADGDKSAQALLRCCCR